MPNDFTNLTNIVTKGKQFLPASLIAPGTTFGDIVGALPATGDLHQFYSSYSDKGNLLPAGIGDSAFKLQFSYLFDIMFAFNPPNSKVHKELKKLLTGLSVDTVKYLIRDISIPIIGVTESNQDHATQFGYINLPGKYVLPTTNKFTINFISAERNVLDEVMYYWMREVTANEWNYDTVPYTRANLYISFLEHSSMSRLNRYVLTNIFPTSVGMIQPNHETLEGFVRSVEFSFSSFYISKPGVISDITRVLSKIAGGTDPEDIIGSVADIGIGFI